MSNQTFGTGNTIVAGTNNFITGENNTIQNGNANTIMAISSTIVDGNGNWVGGIGNTTGAGCFFAHVSGSNNGPVLGFESNVVGDGNRTNANRAGQNISGFAGNFLVNNSVSFAEGHYNYSNQLAGGIENENIYSGDGISVVDQTILNGVYPIGKHKTYQNTSDGLSYSIMLKGYTGLQVGTFVAFDCPTKYSERMIKKAKYSDTVIGVITTTAGMIVNAGEFAASERIQTDVYQAPIVHTNTVMNARLTEHLDEEVYPAFQTILKTGINRATPYVPYNLRSTYYTVAMMGLVVVNTKRKYHLKDMCDVKNGQAVPGDKYYIVQVIDDTHVKILLK